MKFAGLQIKVERNAVYTFFVMIGIFAVVTLIIGLLTGDSREFTVVEVLLVAVAAASFHFLAQFIHMLGHALAAWSTGYPKSGMVFMYVLAMSLYPPDEPTLPARTHIIRSLGGVVAFGLVLLIAFVLWVNSRDSAQWTLRYLTSYMLFDAAFLFLVSAIISDGVLFIVNKEWLPKPTDTKTAS